MIGARLAAERKRLGQTQQAWADRLGVGRSAIAMLETGRAALDVERLLALADEGVDMLYVLTGRHGEVASGELVDWALIERIAAQLQAWEVKRDVRIAQDKRVVVMKYLYLRLVGCKTADDKAVDELLGLAA